MKSETFSHDVLKWFDVHGRKNLPWQRDKNPYFIWVSEIMLQQTQVKTVIPYFEKFIKRFPTIEELACANIDEVLHYWTGLGYYARCRNLHKAAINIVKKHHGQFPNDIDEALALPGIGKSTASAILALSFQQPYAILDGNVKRVLARYFAVEGWPGLRKVENELWSYAYDLLPKKRIADYTQAMMDLGATLCIRSQPKCAQCPIKSTCKGYKQHRQYELPTTKPNKTLPVRSKVIAVIQNVNHAVWLEKRPDVGIWGGLYSFPEFTDERLLMEWLSYTFKVSHFEIAAIEPVTHTFSHFKLHLYPKHIQLNYTPIGVMEADHGVWYKLNKQKIGLAAPVKQTLQKLYQQKKESDHDTHGEMCEAR